MNIANLQIRLSGGADNTDIGMSLGGLPSTTVLRNATEGERFTAEDLDSERTAHPGAFFFSIVDSWGHGAYDNEYTPPKFYVTHEPLSPTEVLFSVYEGAVDSVQNTITLISSATVSIEETGLLFIPYNVGFGSGHLGGLIIDVSSLDFSLPGVDTVGYTEFTVADGQFFPLLDSYELDPTRTYLQEANYCFYLHNVGAEPLYMVASAAVPPVALPSISKILLGEVEGLVNPTTISPRLEPDSVTFLAEGEPLAIIIPPGGDYPLWLKLYMEGATDETEPFTLWSLVSFRF